MKFIPRELLKTFASFCLHQRGYVFIGVSLFVSRIMRNSVETEETVRPLWQSGPRFMGNRHVCSQPSAYIQKLVEQLIAPIFYMILIAYV